MKDEEFFKELTNEFTEINEQEINKELQIPKPIIEMTDKELKQHKKDKQEIIKQKEKEQTQKLKQLKNKLEDNLDDFYQELLLKRSWFEKFMDIFFQRSYMFMGIITKDGTLRIKKVPVKESYLKYKKGLYDIDTTTMLRFKGRVMNVYFEGNPHPIKFDRNINTPLVSSESLDAMFNARLVKQLFQDGLTQGQKLAMGIGGFIGIGIMAVMIIGALKDTTTQTAPIILPFAWNMIKNKIGGINDRR